MTEFDYAARIREQGLNIYFVAEGDRDYHIRRQTVTPANPCCNCYSIAKAFTVTAIGMLCDRGLLTPETRVAEVLRAYMPANADPQWEQVTLHDLMLHQVGFGESGILDIDADDASQYPTKDYLQFVLSTPLPNPRGVERCYTDAAYYVLSRVVAEVSGMDLAAFLRPVLMGTMEFKEMAWSSCPQGYCMGATGLYLRTEDVVKLGILYLNGGVWKGTRVISENWVETVLSRGYELKERDDGWYGKGGMRGQQLIINPQRGLAVACHSFEKVQWQLLIPEE